MIRNRKRSLDHILLMIVSVSFFGKYFWSAKKLREREREREMNDKESKAITRSYLVGQCLNAVKMAIWWTATTPMIYGLSNSSDSVVGMCRASYNAALFLFSPLAGALMECTYINHKYI